MRFYKLILYSVVVCCGTLLLINDVGYGMMKKPTANTACHQQNNQLSTFRKSNSPVWEHIPFVSENRWFWYTCNRYPNDTERLAAYCKNTSNAINSWVLDKNCWHPWLKCHICVCDVWYFSDKNGVCCLQSILEANWQWECKCPEWQQQSIDWTSCDPVGYGTWELIDNEIISPEEPIDSGSWELIDDEIISPEEPIDSGSWELIDDEIISPEDPIDSGSWELIDNPDPQNPGWNDTPPSTGKKIQCPPEEQDSKWRCCTQMYYDLKLERRVCCEWILLNTNVPFIGQCIVFRKKTDPEQPIAGLVVDENTAFPVLTSALGKIMVSLILLSCFWGLMIWWVMISASWKTEEWAKTWKKIIGNVMSALALLGMTWTILYIINPSFFWL